MMEGFNWIYTGPTEGGTSMWELYNNGTETPLYILNTKHVQGYRLRSSNTDPKGGLLTEAPTLDEAKHIAEIYYLTAVKSGD